jgi:transposase InsO family protein
MSVVAKRYSISDETVRKRRKRGEHACQDRSNRPTRLPWRVSEEGRAIMCAVRRATGFPLDDPIFVLRHFLPHLNRDNIYRALRAEGLNRHPAKLSTLPAKEQGRFRGYGLGHVHIDVKHLPKLRTTNGEVRKHYSISQSIAALASCTSLSTRPRMQPTRAFLAEAQKAFPFRIIHVLTDRGFCFTADDSNARARVSSKPDARAVIEQLPTWLEHYNEVHPHRSLGYKSPREFIAISTSEDPSGFQGATTRFAPSRQRR